MLSFRIEEIEIKNVGPFKNLKMKFLKNKVDNEAEIHILTGHNGTGKSTILQCLTSLGFPNNEILRKFHRKSNIDHYYESDIFNDSNSYFTIAINRDSDKYRRFTYFNGNLNVTSYSENTELNDNNNSYISKISNYKNSVFEYAFFAYSGNRQIKKTELKSIQELNISPFENSINFNESVKSEHLIQWIANTKTKEALSLLNNKIDKSHSYRESISKIENIVSEITNQKLQFILETEPLNVVIEFNNEIVPFDLLPDGLKSILSWIGDLLMRMERITWIHDDDILKRNFILFLDEIEIHLHPEWQRRILPIIKKTFVNAQIFISTHSPFVIGSTDNAWVYKLQKDSKGNTILQDSPVKSEDAISYQTILEEIFGITEDFGIEIEKKLISFKNIKNQILLGDRSSIKEIKTIIKDLLGQSDELDTLLNFELRQRKRLTDLDLLR